MRVVQAVRSDGFAGVERHMAVLARALAALGHEVHVLGGRSQDMAAALRGSGARHTSADTTADVVRALVRLRHADVIHTHMTAAEVAALTSRPLVRLPVVSTRHFAGRRLAGSPLRPAAPLIMRGLAAQTAVSHFVASAVDGKSTVIHPGVEPVSGRSDPRTRVVLLAQRYQREKEGRIALRAFAESGLGPQGWQLLVAGRGTQRPELGAEVSDLGISAHTELLGHRPDIGTLMMRSAMLLAPCRVEGLGLTVLEAMARGLPVVAAGAGGHLETVGSASSRYLFRPGDHVRAASLMRELAADPEAAAAYGRRLQQVQRDSFTPAAQAARTAALYEKVLHG